MSGENILVQVPKPQRTKYVSVTFRFDFSTTVNIVRAIIVDAVTWSVYSGKRYPWITGEKVFRREEHTDTISVPLPEGCICYVEVDRGSRRRRHIVFQAIIVPREGVETKIGDSLTIKNAEVLFSSDNITPEVESELLTIAKEKDLAWASTLSLDKRVHNIIATWLIKYVEEQKQREEEMKELAMEFEEVQLQTPTPQKKEEQRTELPELELEEVQVPSPQPPAPAKPQLVKVYFLRMRLPSKYLVQEIKYEDQGGKEVRIFNTSEARRKLATSLESIRRQCYRRIERVFAFVEDFGVWVAVTEEAKKEAEDISKYVVKQIELLSEYFRQLGISVDEVKRRYFVKAVPVYLEPSDALALLESAIAHLSKDVEELSRRIEEAEKEQNKRKLRELMNQRSVKQNLLEAFRSFLERLEREYGLLSTSRVTAVTEKRKSPEEELREFLRELLRLPEDEAYRKLKDEVEVVDWWFTACPDHRARIKVKGKEMELIVEYTPPYIPELENLGFTEDEVRRLSRIIHSVVLAKTPELLRKIKDDKYYLSVMKIMLPPDM